MRPEGKESLTRPADFEFMPMPEWHAFNERLRDEAEESDLDIVRLEPGTVVLADGRKLSVMNLAQMCHLNGEHNWSDLIGSHFATLSAHVGGSPDPFSMLDLRVMLLPDAQADRHVLQLLGARPFAEGVVETLAVRLDEAVRPVATREIDELGWDLDESWASAWAQTRTMERPEEMNFIEANGAQIVHLFSEHFFGASFLPYLDDVLDGLGEHGALVSMPVRHSVIVHPIYDSTVMMAAQVMIPITRQVNRKGPGAVSAHLYWWRHGSLTWIPTYFAPDGVEFYAPADFDRVIESFDDLS